MWESRRDFQRVWEGWEAGLTASHAFHTLSFHGLLFVRQMLDEPICRHKMKCAADAYRYSSVVNECIDDLAPTVTLSGSLTRKAFSETHKGQSDFMPSEGHCRALKQAWDTPFRYS